MGIPGPSSAMTNRPNDGLPFRVPTFPTAAASTPTLGRLSEPANWKLTGEGEYSMSAVTSSASETESFALRTTNPVPPPSFAGSV